MTTVMLSTAFVAIDCPTCGFVFAVPETFRDRCRREGRSARCPAGEHTMNWGESEADKLRRLLDNARRRTESAEAQLTHERDQREAAERSARAQRAANTPTTQAGCRWRLSVLSSHVREPGAAHDRTTSRVRDHCGRAVTATPLVSGDHAMQAWNRVRVIRGQRKYGQDGYVVQRTTPEPVGYNRDGSIMTSVGPPFWVPAYLLSPPRADAS